MIMVNVKEQKQRGPITRPWHTGPPYMAFEIRELTEMISLAVPSREHSHALKPSGSPIKVTNIEIMIKL